MTTTTPGPSALRGAVGTARTRIEGREKVTGAARYAGEIPSRTWHTAGSCSPPSPVADPRRGDRPGPRHAGRAHGAPPRQRPPPQDRLRRHARHPAGPDLRRLPERPGAVRRLAGRARRRRDPRGGQGSGRSARGDVRQRTARHRAPPGPPRRLPRRRPYARRDGEGRPGGSTGRLRLRGGRGVHHARRAAQHDGTARGDRPVGGRPAGGRRLQPGRRLGPGRTGHDVLARRLLGAGALRTHRRRLRQQGPARPPGVRRRDGRHRPAAPGPGGADPASDVLAGRLPQPHHPAGQARRGPRRPAAGPGTPLAEPDVHGVRVRRAQRGRRPGAVRRRRPPHRQPRRPARRAVPDLDARTGEAPGSFAIEAALDELAERGGIDPIELRLRNEPEVGPVSGLRSPATTSPPASAKVPAGSAGRTATRAPVPAARDAGCWAPARRRPPSARGRPLDGPGHGGGGRLLHRTHHRRRHRHGGPHRAYPDRRRRAGDRTRTGPGPHRRQRLRPRDDRRRIHGHPVPGLCGHGGRRRTARAALR